MKRRARPEDQIQRAVLDHLRLRGVPGLLYWHTPNGGWRTAIEGAIMKGLGVKAGVSDLCLLHDGRFFALELKREDGRETEAQMAFRLRVNRAGGFAAVAFGLDAALLTLQAWGLMRGR